MTVERVPTRSVPPYRPAPTVCSRHGRRAVEFQAHRFTTRRPWWVYLLLPLGALPFVLVTVILRKTIEVPAWPVCSSCRTRRRLLHWTGLVLILGALSTLGVGIALSGPTIDTDASLTDVVRLDSPELLGIGALVASILTVWGVVTRSRARASTIARGRLTRDGSELRFRRPAAAFVGQIQSLAVTGPAAPPANLGGYPPPGIPPNIGTMPHPGVPWQGAGKIPPNRAPVPLEYTMPIRRIPAAITPAVPSGLRGVPKPAGSITSMTEHPRDDLPRRRDVRAKKPAGAGSPQARHRR